MTKEENRLKYNTTTSEEENDQYITSAHKSAALVDLVQVATPKILYARQLT